MEYTDKLLKNTCDLVYLRTYEDGSQCIVKLIKQSQERKGQEYRIMKALHEAGVSVPKIIRYEEVEVRRGWKHYTEMIVMEYIPGHTLQDVSIKKNLPLHVRQENPPDEETKKIALRMLDLVEKVHKTGYYHGDLHSANFIWDGENLTLIDFGRAYGAEFHKNLKEETFQPTYEHARTLCREVPHLVYLQDLDCDWNFYSLYEEQLLTNCIYAFVGGEEDAKSIAELRDMVERW
jgi:serine/threonine protein kinase